MIRNVEWIKTCLMFRLCSYSFSVDVFSDMVKYCRYVFGMTHIPRLEDWPVMPVERIGFLLMVLHSKIAYFLAILSVKKKNILY